jgi:hypothetical protein
MPSAMRRDTTADRQAAYALDSASGEKLGGQNLGGAFAGGIIAYPAASGVQRVAAATGFTMVA